MKKLLVGFVMAAAPLTMMAQNGDWCGTQKKFEEAVIQDPALSVEWENLNNWILQNQDYIMSTSEGGNFVIPVVVHVVHNYGVENISDAQIVDAINILNEDFNAANADTNVVVNSFKPIIGNTHFTFRLAKIDPNGNCTNGITRTVSTLTDEATDASKVIYWPRNKYYNMWIVRDIREDGGSGGVTAGYAYYPGTAPSASVDGILVQHNYVGTIGTSSGANFNKRVITHETGHFFSLIHPWGNGPINTNCGSDQVADTPPTRGSFSTCNLSQANCGQLENVQNYMDYASCTRMFTQGQSTRMTTAINSGAGQRSSLWTNSNLVATGTNDGYVPQNCAPKADFSAANYSVCVGSSISFVDHSWNATPTSWNWTFTNGSTTLNSTLENPVIQFDQPGVYDVTLTVSAAGGNDTKTKNALVFVFTTTPVASSNYQYSDMFDSDPLVSGRWALPFSQLPNNGWEQTTQSSYSAPNSVMVDNFGAPSGNMFSIISPSYDFTQIPTPVVMTFKHAFAQRDNDNEDVLKVYISSNCGQTWSLRGTYAGSDLATTSIKTSDWFPGNTNLWAETTIQNLNAYYTKTNVRFRFEFTSGGGNNLFLDDINIHGPLGIDDADKTDIGLTLYPNPASENVNLKFTLDREYDVKVRLMDITGRTIQTINSQSYAAGDNQILMNLSSGTSAGLYLVEVTIGSKRYVERLIIQ